MAKYDKDAKFYWLQLKEDFFENDAIEWLEEQKPNGRDYAYFYLKLCLKSLKSNGVLIRKVGNILIPYDNQKLSELTKIDFDTVTVAMDLLQKIGLIQILENGEIYINQLEELIGSKSIGAFKKQQQRLLGGQMSTSCPPKCPPKIDIDIEKEKEIDTKIEDKKVTTYNQGAFKYFEENIDVLTPKTAEMIEDYQKEIPDDLICYAIDKAVMAKKRNPSYVFGILRNWSNKGIKTVLMAKEEEQNFKKVLEEPKKEDDKWASFIAKGDD